MIIRTQPFKTRADLDAYIRSEFGVDIEANRAAGHTIEGSEAELLELGLSPSVRVYGVEIKIEVVKKKAKKRTKEDSTDPLQQIKK